MSKGATISRGPPIPPHSLGDGRARLRGARIFLSAEHDRQLGDGNRRHLLERQGRRSPKAQADSSLSSTPTCSLFVIMSVARPNSVLTWQRRDVVSDVRVGSALNLGIELPFSTDTPTSLTYNRATGLHSSSLHVIERVFTQGRGTWLGVKHQQSYRRSPRAST
jgi:hypothetical protein